MARSTDFNVRRALKRNQSLLTGALETGRTALAGYEELTPQYNTAVQAARDYQSILAGDYNQYAEDRNTAVTEYNELLKNRRATVQTALQRQKYLGQLEERLPALQTEGSTLYSTYEKSFQDAMSAEYEKQLKNTKYAKNLTAYQLTNLTVGTPDYQRVEKENSKFTKDLAALEADTGFATRFAQNESASDLQGYETFLSETYNPALQEIDTVRSSFDLPAASAALQATLDDKGFADRAASETKAVFDAYEGMTPQLNEYSRQVQTSKEQVQEISGQIPGLQRSLEIDMEARKRGDRLGYRRSILSRGFKRRGTAR